MINTVLNHNEGKSYLADKWAILDRFLMLGVEGNTYYATPKALLLDSCKNLVSCISEDGSRVVARVVEVSDKGLSSKQDVLLFVLAACASSKNDKTRATAWNAMPVVCRTASTMLKFLAELRSFRTISGRMALRALRNWYTQRSADQLAYQMIKYRSREGWSHVDVLRLAHVKPATEAHGALFKWAAKGFNELGEDLNHLPKIVIAYENVQNMFANGKVEMAVKEFLDNRLPMEALPTEMLANADTWKGLSEYMPITNTIRNLGNLSRHGISSSEVIARLTNADIIRAGRVHPLSVLNAFVTYKNGAGLRSSNSWAVQADVLQALDETFRLSFGAVNDMGKTLLLGLDVSGSMRGTTVSNNALLPAGLAQASMANMYLNTQRDVHVIGYNRNSVDLSNLRADQTLAQALSAVESKLGGATDCSAPVRYALENKLVVDAFIIFTDAENSINYSHACDPSVALTQYNKEMGTSAKLVMVAMANNYYSIAPNREDVLNVVGFDPSIPSVIEAFLNG